MKDYYHIVSQQISDDNATFVVVLNPNCAVYKGHFPSQPIAPGACSIEMIRQCASMAMGHEVRLSRIIQCKFTLLLVPDKDQELRLQLALSSFQLTATLSAQNQVAIKLKAEIQCVQ